MGDKDLGEAISTGRRSQEAGGLWVLRPERVAGCFCLPVVPRRSRSRAAVQLTGFPTGRPGGRGRGGPCSTAGARPPAPPGSGAGGRAPQRCSAPRDAGSLRGRPSARAPRPRRRGWDPGCSGFSRSQQVPGASLRGQALGVDKDWRVPAITKTTGVSRRLCVEPQRAARELCGRVAAALRVWRKRLGSRETPRDRGAPWGSVPGLLLIGRSGLGQMIPPLHPTIRAGNLLCATNNAKVFMCRVSGKQ